MSGTMSIDERRSEEGMGWDESKGREVSSIESELTVTKTKEAIRKQEDTMTGVMMH